jgi:hypothetical protein
MKDNTLLRRLREPIKHPQECVNQRLEAAKTIEELENQVDILECCLTAITLLDGRAGLSNIAYFSQTMARDSLANLKGRRERL